MALKRTPELAKRKRVIRVAKSEMRCRRIERRRRMALGHHEAVAFWVVKTRRPQIQLGAIKASDEIGAGERTARMPRPGVINGGNRNRAYGFRGLRKLRDELRVMGAARGGEAKSGSHDRTPLGGRPHASARDKVCIQNDI